MPGTLLRKRQMAVIHEDDNLYPRRHCDLCQWSHYGPVVAFRIKGPSGEKDRVVMICDECAGDAIKWLASDLRDIDDYYALKKMGFKRHGRQNKTLFVPEATTAN
jgi:hypothetical protein